MAGRKSGGSYFKEDKSISLRSELVGNSSWAPKSLQMVTEAMKLRRLLLGRKAMINLDTLIKKQRHYFANKGPSSQGYDFSSVMYGCKSWTIKKAEY